MSHHLSIIRYHKFAKFFLSRDLEGEDLKNNSVVNVTIDPSDYSS